MPRCQGRQDRRELVSSERIGRRDDDSPREARARSQRLLGVVEPAQQRARPRGEVLAGVGKVELPCRAVHQRSPELLFQPAQVTARHGEGHSQGARCARNATRLGDSYEGGHLVEHANSSLHRGGCAGRPTVDWLMMSSNMYGRIG